MLQVKQGYLAGVKLLNGTGWFKTNLSLQHDAATKIFTTIKGKNQFSTLLLCKKFLLEPFPDISVQ